MFLYYITDRTQFPGNEAERRRAVLDKIAEAASCGVDYIQLREKDLSTRELEALARQAVAIIRNSNQRRADNLELRTRLLINSRTDVALAAGADGVHLRSEDIAVSTVRFVWSDATLRSSQPGDRSLLLAVSCHTPADAQRAAAGGADFAVFAPVFGKRDRPNVRPTGLDMLHNACNANLPVLALGGVTMENAAACMRAGAAGIAGIRIFQENDLAIVIPALRQIRSPL